MGAPSLDGTPNAKCNDCGSECARGTLDRSGQEWWCPTCAKEYAMKARQEWEYNNRKWREEGL